MFEMKLIGARIASLRRSKGLSQDKFAIRAGIPAPSLRRWERGATADMSLRAAIHLANVLGVSLDTLCGLDGTTLEVMPPESPRRGRPRKAEKK